MLESLIVLASLIGSVAVIWGSAVIIWPAAARIKFISALEHARDDCDDAVLRGELPDADCTRHFIRKADSFKYGAKGMSISSTWAMIMAFGAEDLRLIPSSPSYAKLTPFQRNLMHELDKRVTLAISKYLVDGSRLWWILKPALLVLRRRNRKLRGQGVYPTVMNRKAEPRELAADLQRLADDGRPFQVGPVGRPSHAGAHAAFIGFGF